jgi:hypothetical protein
MGLMLIRYEDQHGTPRAYGQPPEADAVLFSSADGRTLFILRPFIKGISEEAPSLLALRAANLFRQFQHRPADRIFNCVIPKPRAPQYCGELVEITYYAEKHLGPGDSAPAEWVHYFEEPGVQPAYAPIYKIGRGQFLIPPGPFKVTDRGIEWARPPHRTRRVNYGGTEAA